MTARAAALAAAVLALCGCAEAPPAGPTELQVTEYNARMLQTTWINTGLSEVFSRPVVEQGPPLTIDDWFNAVFTCLAARGYEGYSLSYGAGQGASVGSGSGEAVTDAAVQLAFYGCAAAHPVDVVATHELLSPAQIEYVYDYYQQWVVPCMSTAGFTVRDAPTRQAFRDGYGQWSPYWSVNTTIGGSEVEDLQRICGADRPAL